MIGYYLGCLGVVLLAFVFVAICFALLMKRKEYNPEDENTAEMPVIAKIIRDGAFTFMKTEYVAISVAVVVIAILATLFIEKTSGLTFIAGALASSCVCVFGAYLP